MNLKNKILLGLAAVALPFVSMPVMAQGAVPEKFKWLSFVVFGAIIALTMYVTYVAAKRVKTAKDFYTAGGGVSGLQNGWAIAGDYLSAASFLGIAGLISIWGYDGFMYSVGWLVAYISVLLVIAEPCRNIGKYTLADILAYRNDPKTTRIVGALSVVTVSTFYLLAQMVGGGVLVKTLIGIDYEISVICVGVVMLAYVLFGGMVATTWVQIIKAVLLVCASIVMVILVWSQYGFFGDFLQNVVGNEAVQKRVASILGDAAKNMSPEELGQRFLEPGLLFKAPIDQISLGMALVFGTAGMPHILMRFFTVPNAQEARKSVVWAMAIIGGFYVLTLFLGMGAAMKVGPSNITAVDPGGNMANPLLAQALGGGAESLMGNFMMAFVSAVAFATIVAVVAGLVLAAASAMAHDLYVGVIRGEHATQEEQVKAARIATVVFGSIAIVLGIAAKGQNVAHLVALAFAVASSANFPCVLLTLFWKRCNTRGIVAGMLVGTVTAIGLVLVSPNMTYPIAVKAASEKAIKGADDKLTKLNADLAALDAPLAKLNADLAAAADDAAKAPIKAEIEKATAAKGETEGKIKTDIAKQEKAKAGAQKKIDDLGGATTSMVGLDKPWFELKNPGLISIPLGFLAVILGSLTLREKRSEEMWDELYVRQTTGILAAKAVSH
jgi:cation/acetate symporter